MSLLPTALERKLSERRPHPLALSPPKQEAMTPKPQEISTPCPPSIGQDPESKDIFPLTEVAGPEGPTRLHFLGPPQVPFLISDRKQIEEKLVSFSENPTRYRKKFLCLTQACHLTWNDLYYVLNATLTPDEKEQIWQAAQTHADHLHNQDRANPVTDDAVSLTEPQWIYQAGNASIWYLHHMITC